MKRLLPGALCFLVAVCAVAGDLEGVRSLVGREFSVQDDWAGQELAFREKDGSIVAVWRVLGSGRPVLSEIEYPVEIKSARQCVFEVQLGDKNRHRVKIELGKRNEVRAYLNGIRIQIDEKQPDQRSQPKPPKRED